MQFSLAICLIMSNTGNMNMTLESPHRRIANRPIGNVPKSRSANYPICPFPGLSGSFQPVSNYHNLNSPCLLHFLSHSISILCVPAPQREKHPLKTAKNRQMPVFSKPAAGDLNSPLHPCPSAVPPRLQNLGPTPSLEILLRRTR